jgi:Na+/proline symporter
MLTSFSLSELILISAGYLLVLFGVAWVSEHGLIPRWIIRHPLTYTLSLGVYASAWAFYGTVGLAYQYGYGFLASYLGVSGAFLLAPVLLYPILRITRTYQLSSLADLFAFRFRSTCSCSSACCRCWPCRSRRWPTPSASSAASRCRKKWR